MKNLVIHPTDASTDFLKPIYANITDATILNGGMGKGQVAKLISEHDRIIMMGHGSPFGLFSVGQFIGKNGYVIDDTMSDLLIEKKNNILIWCYASDFAVRMGLKGFFTGMFISEISEAMIFDMKVSQKTIDESNECFVNVISNLVTKDAKDIYESIMVSEYRYISKHNPIAKYNIDRLKFIN